jgi:hypothetical protein
MLKSLMLEIERDAPDLFELVRSTVFRTWNKPTIISDFVLRWALAHGFAKTIDHSHLYIATGQSLETQSLKHLKKLFGMLDFFVSTTPRTMLKTVIRACFKFIKI